jgi:hypothetical protein
VAAPKKPAAHPKTAHMVVIAGEPQEEGRLFAEGRIFSFFF